AAVLEHDELLPAGHIDEQGQHEEKDAVVGVDQSTDGEQQRKNEAEVNGNHGCLTRAEPWPQNALQQSAGIEWEADNAHIEEEQNPVDPEEALEPLLPLQQLKVRKRRVRVPQRI